MASVFSFIVLVILHVMIVALLFLRQSSSGHAQLLSNFVTILSTTETEAILLKDDSPDYIIITSAARGRKMLMDQFSSKVKKEKHISARRASNVAGDATSESKKAPPLVQLHPMTAQVDRTKEFRDAENEVARLMSKDYSGRSGPRRKPPINNHKPTD
uniref:Uncharacterized protein n=1 Tax=Nicotiana tabacum TaxID=4097 RepID=A0A1S3XZD1_TOBAC|nr:PREDICTED: uncharacterized protein LOC107770408 [Nicotiana tabacum]